MSKSSMPAPKYTFWQTVQTALAVGIRALEEVRTLAREPGPRGPDGLGFDDLEIVHDGLRHFTFRMKRGDEVKEFSFDVPVMIYAGIFKEGTEYKYGDTVTWGGSLWHCDLDTTDKPGGGSPWTLVAKHGRDGRNGDKGDPGPKGDKGAPGQDFTMAIAGR